jgi:hypothetical protein
MPDSQTSTAGAWQRAARGEAAAGRLSAGRLRTLGGGVWALVDYARWAVAAGRLRAMAGERWRQGGWRDGLTVSVLLSWRLATSRQNPSQSQVTVCEK